MASAKSILLKIGKYILLFGAAGVLVYLAFRKVDWKAFYDGLLQTRWFWVVLFCIASVLALVGRLFRWKELLNPFDKSLSYLRVWDAMNVGNVASVAIPTSGELLRCGYVTTKKLQYDKALGTMFAERVWDVGASIILLALALTLQWNRLGDFFKENLLRPLSSFGFWWILAALVVLAAVFIWIMFRLRDRNKFCDKVAASISRLWDGFTAFGKSKNKLIIALSTVFIWFMYVLMSFFIVKAMPALEGIGFNEAMFLAAVGNVASVVPVPGGIGAYHYLVAATLGVYGYSWDTGILYATLNHEIHAVVIIAIGIISYLHIVKETGRKSNDVNGK